MSETATKLDLVEMEKKLEKTLASEIRELVFSLNKVSKELSNSVVESKNSREILLNLIEDQKKIRDDFDSVDDRVLILEQERINRNANKSNIIRDVMVALTFITVIGSVVNNIYKQNTRPPSQIVLPK